jgi:hypothetical protein
MEKWVILKRIADSNGMRVLTQAETKAAADARRQNRATTSVSHRKPPGQKGNKVSDKAVPNLALASLLTVFQWKQSDSVKSLHSRSASQIDEGMYNCAVCPALLAATDHGNEVHSRPEPMLSITEKPWAPRGTTCKQFATQVLVDVGDGPDVMRLHATLFGSMDVFLAGLGHCITSAPAATTQVVVELWEKWDDETIFNDGADNFSMFCKCNS